MADIESEVARFYRSRSIFITGASGFIGKVLLEKLLRSCSGLTNIYVLIRPKRGNEVKKRMEDLLNSKLFDNIRRDSPSVLQKVIPIIGDITQPNLGITDTDANLLYETVSIVFHSAATVRFDEPLKQAAALNILGTKSIVELCRKMKNLSALIHVSTAYCNCDQKETNETLYPPPADPMKFVEWLQWMNEDLVNQITPKLLGKRPNTYTYTKAMAESLFSDMACNMPAAIVRPSIVTASLKEPMVGWVDNLNGPTGLIAGIGKGALRTLLCHEDLVCDIVPVDILCNELIVVAWRTATVKSNNMMIYNCTSSTVNPIKWRDFRRVLEVEIVANPLANLMWYPGGRMHTSKFVHSVNVYLYHLLPARILDAISFAIGKKPFFGQLQSKLWKAVDSLEYFTTHEWKFSCQNTTALFNQLSAQDKQLFNFDPSKIYWDDYLISYFNGVRKFVLRETNQKSNIRQMYILKQTFNIIAIYILLKLARIGVPSARKLSYSMLKVALFTASLLTFKK